jgi:localization factor PodJL
MYARGRGATANLVEAYVWFAVAAKAGTREAERGRDAVARYLAPARQAAAEERAREIVAAFKRETAP